VPRALESAHLTGSRRTPWSSRWRCSGALIGLTWYVSIPWLTHLGCRTSWRKCSRWRATSGAVARHGAQHCDDGARALVHASDTWAPVLFNLDRVRCREWLSFPWPADRQQL